MARRKRRSAYRSGYCLYAKHQYPCKGEFENGANIRPSVVLCSCDCHGDYEERMVAAGQRLPEETDPVESYEDEDTYDFDEGFVE